MRPKATTCLYCGGSDGKIHEGAHHGCKARHTRAKIKERGGKLVFTECADCKGSGPWNNKGRCQKCQAKHTAASQKKSNAKWAAARKRERQPAVAATAPKPRPTKPMLPKTWDQPAPAKVEAQPMIDPRPIYGPFYRVHTTPVVGLRDLFGVYGPARLATDDWGNR